MWSWESPLSPLSFLFVGGSGPLSHKERLEPNGYELALFMSAACPDSEDCFGGLEMVLI